MKTYHYRGEATLIPIEQIRPSKMTGRKEPKLPRLQKACEELASGAAIEPVAVFDHNGEYLLADGMHRYTAEGGGADPSSLRVLGVSLEHQP